LIGSKINSKPSMSFLSNLFKAKPFIKDLGVLGVDFHSHFLYGIDDGAEQLNQSIEMIGAMQEYGFRKLITTPHIMGDYYKNSAETILPKLLEVQSALQLSGLTIQLEAAAEYYCDEMLMKKVENDEIMSFSSKYVLLELSFINPSDFFDVITFNLQMNGYKIILAHPERYSYWHQSIDKLQAIKDKGVFLQLNLGALVGQYGSGVKRVAERLIEEEMIDFVGSDAHKIEHIVSLEKLFNNHYFSKLISSGRLLNSTL
jgi:tyrosine-protein phosphatase YwqE